MNFVAQIHLFCRELRFLSGQVKPRLLQARHGLSNACLGAFDVGVQRATAQLLQLQDGLAEIDLRNVK